MYGGESCGQHSLPSSGNVFRPRPLTKEYLENASGTPADAGKGISADPMNGLFSRKSSCSGFFLTKRKRKEATLQCVFRCSKLQMSSIICEFLPLRSNNGFLRNPAWVWRTPREYAWWRELRPTSLSLLGGCIPPSFTDKRIAGKCTRHTC